MNFLLFSDLHLNLWNVNQSRRRLDDCIVLLHGMFDYAREHNIKRILFCGDFFHTHSSIRTELLEATYNLFAEADDLEFIFLTGNHDQTHKSDQTSRSTEFLRSFGDVVGVGTSFIYKDDMPRLAAMEYKEDEEQVKRFLGELEADSIVLMHQGIRNVEINSKGFTLNEGISVDWVPDNIMHLFAGHFHSHKRVNDKITIPGSFVQHNFGDTGEHRGFLDVTIEGKNLSYKQVTNPSLFHIVNWGEELPYFENRWHAVKVKNVPQDATVQVESPHVQVENEVEEVEFSDTQATDNLAIFDDFVKAYDIPDKERAWGERLLLKAELCP